MEGRWHHQPLVGSQAGVVQQLLGQDQIWQLQLGIEIRHGPAPCPPAPHKLTHRFGWLPCQEPSCGCSSLVELHRVLKTTRLVEVQRSRHQCGMASPILLQLLDVECLRNLERLEHSIKRKGRGPSFFSSVSVIAASFLSRARTRKVHSLRRLESPLNLVTPKRPSVVENPWPAASSSARKREKRRPPRKLPDAMAKRPQGPGVLSSAINAIALELCMRMPFVRSLEPTGFGVKSGLLLIMANTDIAYDMSKHIAKLSVPCSECRFHIEPKTQNLCTRRLSAKPVTDGLGFGSMTSRLVQDPEEAGHNG